MKKKQQYILVSIASLIILLIVWGILAQIQGSAYLPGPASVFAALGDSFIDADFTGHYMHEHIAASLYRVIAGLILALAIAVPCGLLMGWSMWAKSAGRPIVEVFRPIPPLAWVPVAIVVMGSASGAVFIVFLGIFFPILLNTIFGVEQIDPVLLDAAKTLGAKKGKLFTKVILPATLPHIMSGIRIGVGIGWMCIAAAEMIGVSGQFVSGGVGFYIWSHADIGMFDKVFAGMILIGILGLVTTEGLRQIEKRLAYKVGVS